MLLRVHTDDMWDPNTWPDPDDHEHRIYADETLETYAVVDAKYYPILCRYKWSVHDKRKAARGHIYLRRTVCVFHGPDGEPYESRTSGKVVRHRRRTVFNRFLHTEVMLLSGREPPTPEHDEVDHIDRNKLNCVEENLQWATREMNTRNSNNAIRIKNLRRGRTYTSTSI